MTASSKTADSQTPAQMPVSTHHLAGLLDVLSAGIFLLDRDLRVIMANTPAGRLLGPCVDAATALSLADAADSKHDWQGMLREVLRTGEGRRVEKYRLARGTNDTRILNIAIVPASSSTDRNPALAVVLDDLTEQYDLEERARRAEDMAAVGRLAARVAHELNNPLDGAMRYLSLCERALGTEAESHRDALRYVDEARQGLLRMARIVADLLAFSRNAPMVKESVNINAIVDEAIRSMSEHADRNGVVVAAGFRDDDLMPTLGGTRLYQVCCNLVRNAIDAMPTGGCLTVTTGVVGEDVIIRVEDTGVGLPDDPGRVFEPFYTTKAAGKGTGLGLAICRDYINQLGGTIQAETNKPKGAVFTVRVPLTSCQPTGRSRSSD